MADERPEEPVVVLRLGREAANQTVLVPGVDLLVHKAEAHDEAVVTLPLHRAGRVQHLLCRISHDVHVVVLILEELVLHRPRHIDLLRQFVLLQVPDYNRYEIFLLTSDSVVGRAGNEQIAIVAVDRVQLKNSVSMPLDLVLVALNLLELFPFHLASDLIVHLISHLTAVEGFWGL